MKRIRAYLAALGRMKRKSSPNPLLHFDAHGICVETGGRLSARLEWSDVREVFAFKDDVFACDIICIGFRTDDGGTYWKVDEECEGYRELVDFLPEIFSGIRTDWFSDVAFPTFKPCVTSLWGESRIGILWNA